MLRRSACGLGLALAALPFLCAEFIPATDLPQHLAQVRLLEELWGLTPKTLDTSYLIARPFGTNSAVYLPMLLLGRLLPPVLLGRLSVLCITLSSVLALQRLARVRQRSLWLTWLAGMLLYSHVLYWGFLNFFAGLALFLWALPSLIASPLASWRERAGVALTLVALAWAHVFWLPWACLALVIAQLERPRELRGYAVRAACALPAIAFVAADLPSMLAARARFDTLAVYVKSPLSRLEPRWLRTSFLGGPNVTLDKAACGLLALCVFALAVDAFMRKRRDAWDKPLLYLSVCLLAFGLLAPDLYLDTICFGQRFVPLAGMLAIMAAPAPRWRAWIGLTGVAACGFALATALHWRDFDLRQLSGLRAALYTQPPPASVLGLDLRDRRAPKPLHPYMHSVAYFQAVHGSAINFSFAAHGSSIVAYREHPPVRWNPQLAWAPNAVTRADLAAFQCALVNGHEDQQRWFRELSGWRARADQGYFRLYCR